MTRDGPKFMDFSTLKLVEIKGDESRWVTGGRTRNTRWRLASADGTTFAAWEPGLSPSGIRTLTLDGMNAHSRYEHNSAGALLPSDDGSLLFTSTGIFSTDLKPVSAEQFRNTLCIPSYLDGQISETAIANDGFLDGDGIVWPEAPHLHGITVA